MAPAAANAPAVPKRKPPAMMMRLPITHVVQLGSDEKTSIADETLPDKFGTNRVPGETFSIRTVGRHRVVGVRNRDDGDLDRKLVAFESARVAGAVVALVMRKHQLCPFPEFGKPAEKSVADLRVS